MIAGEIAGSFDRRDNRPVSRTCGENPSSQEPKRIVIPGCDPGQNVDEAVVHFLGPNHLNPLGFDPAKPLNTVYRQRRDHDARGAEESRTRHLSEPLHISCGASPQADDPDVRVGEARFELMTARRGFQPGVREQLLNRIPKDARLVIQRDHGAPSRIGKPQGYIRLIVQRAHSQYSDLNCGLAVAKQQDIVAISCLWPGSARVER